MYIANYVAISYANVYFLNFSFLKTSKNVTSFIRTFNKSDLIEIVGGAPKDSISYGKIEKTTFINGILFTSRGTLHAGLELGHNQSLTSPNDTFSSSFNFGKAFEVNGAYVLEKIYCKQRNKRSVIFTDLTSSNVQKGSLNAVIDLSK